MPILATLRPPAPPVNPPDIPVELVDLTIAWYAWDGSVWDLGSPDSGVRLNAGFRGFGMPDLDWFTDEAAGVDGSTDRGFRAKPREVFWPLRVYKPELTQAWYDYDRAFWATLHPGRRGRFEVTQPNGVTRSLTLRLQDDGQPVFDTLPGLNGWYRYGVTMLANQPYWEGPATVQTFANAEDQDFWGGGWALTGSFNLASATVSNPGDIDTWPIYTIIGPSTAVLVGVGDSLIEVPFTLTGSDSLVIDTDPTAQTALKNGVDVTGSLGVTEFAPVPAGQDVPLALSMTGAGSVSVAVKPRYWRAW